MHLDDLIAYLDASPSPWHAAASSVDRLRTAGFAELALDDEWRDVPAKGFVQRGAAVVAWHRGDAAGPTSPVRLVGAHTDSPCLRVKPNADAGGFGWKQLAVEVYGGVLLNSWLDRDLGVAGTVVLRDGTTRLVAVHDAVARVPQLAIHLDRDVNERGVVLDKQQHLSPSGASAIPHPASSATGSPPLRASPGPRSPTGTCPCSTARPLPCSARREISSPPAASTTRPRAGPPPQHCAAQAHRATPPP